MSKVTIQNNFFSHRETPACPVVTYLSIISVFSLIMLTNFQVANQSCHKSTTFLVTYLAWKYSGHINWNRNTLSNISNIANNFQHSALPYSSPPKSVTRPLRTEEPSHFLSPSSISWPIFCKFDIWFSNKFISSSTCYFNITI